MSKRQTKYKKEINDLDIVILTYNTFGYLRTCLEKIQDAVGDSISYHITVIDNGSQLEDSKKFSEEIYPLYGNKMSIYRVDTNVGFPVACNYGASTATSKYILFLNDDAFMLPGSIEKMIERLKSNESIGIVGAKLLFPEDSTDPTRPAGKIQHAGIAFNITSNAVHVFVGWSANTPKANIPCEVDAVTGACLLIRRKLFNKVGKFFTGYGAGTYEDIDLCLSVKKAGYKVWYEPEAVGYHKVGGAGFRFPLPQNQLTFMSRWGTSGLIRWTEVERL